MRRAGRATFTYHQINSNQKTGFIQPFADIMTLPECQATSHWGTRARSYTGIECVNVEAKVNWLRPVWVYSIQSLFHYIAYPVSIYFMHGERCNVVFSENHLLPPVYVPQANICQAWRMEVDRVEPRKWGRLTAVSVAERLGTRQRGQKRQGHAVNVPYETEVKWISNSEFNKYAPESVVSCVLMSACASIQITQASGYLLNIPSHEMWKGNSRNSR